jgi:hypothetical protein
VLDLKRRRIRTFVPTGKIRFAGSGRAEVADLLGWTVMIDPKRAGGHG